MQSIEIQYQNLVSNVENSAIFVYEMIHHILLNVYLVLQDIFEIEIFILVIVVKVNKPSNKFFSNFFYKKNNLKKYKSCEECFNINICLKCLNRYEINNLLNE